MTDPRYPYTIHDAIRHAGIVRDVIPADTRSPTEKTVVLLLEEVQRLTAQARVPGSFFDFIRFLHAQREWSTWTFGPGPRPRGIVAHIRRELEEILSAPEDVEEWIDVVILALDGAWRAGASPEDIVTTLQAKFDTNRKRVWPDWRTVGPEAAIEHLEEGK